MKNAENIDFKTFKKQTLIGLQERNRNFTITIQFIAYKLHNRKAPNY